MRPHETDEIGPHAARVLMDRWHLDEHTANAALDEAARDLGVAVADLAGLVVAAAAARHLQLVSDRPVELKSLAAGARIVYGRRERPLVEVRVDSSWHRGLLCNQIEGAGGWWLYVLHHRPNHPCARLARFRPRDVRLVTTPSPEPPTHPWPNDPNGFPA